MSDDIEALIAREAEAAEEAEVWEGHELSADCWCGPTVERVEPE